MRRSLYDLCARDYIIRLGAETRIMGIVNCTPDSFSNDGKVNSNDCLRRARKLIREGADIIDIGGESTRPGALGVSLKEEIRRVIPVIEGVSRKTKIPVSIDTSKIEVAHRALDAGASIVNNVRATQMSTSFLKLVRDYGACIVIMHMRGTPLSMQSKARYKNVVKEVIEELQISVEKCLEIGIKKDRIIVDPGIGFAKTNEHNLMLIKDLHQLNVLRCPILLGTSRKSFIGQILGHPADERLMGTAASVVWGVTEGAHLVRAHDVKAIKESLKVTDAILNAHA